MFKMFFHHIRTAQGYKKKSKNPDKDIEHQEFCGKMVLFHGFFTSNLYPIPHTVAIDQCQVVLDFFSQAFDVNVDSTGVTDVFIAPDMIQKLFSGEYLVWRGSKKIEKFQFFWRHVYLTAHISDCSNWSG